MVSFMLATSPLCWLPNREGDSAPSRLPGANRTAQRPPEYRHYTRYSAPSRSLGVLEIDVFIAPRRSPHYSAPPGHLVSSKVICAFLAARRSPDHSTPSWLLDTLLTIRCPGARHRLPFFHFICTRCVTKMYPIFEWKGLIMFSKLRHAFHTIVNKIKLSTELYKQKLPNASSFDAVRSPK